MGTSNNVILPQGTIVSVGNGPVELQAGNLSLEFASDNNTPTAWFTLAAFEKIRVNSSAKVWALSAINVSAVTVSPIVLRSVGGAGAGASGLNALSVAAPVVMAGASAGAVVSAISGVTFGSTLALQDSHSGAVALFGSNLVVGATPPSSSGSFTITLQETLAGANNSPRSTTLTLTMADVIVSASGNDANAGTLTAPVATLHKARLLIAAGLANAGGRTRNFVVLFRNGSYYLSATEVFTLADTAGAGYTVTYKAYPGEAATISGGQVLSGFVVDGATGHWTLTIPSVAAGTWYFGEIWVNAQRAKWPIWPVPGGDRLHVARQVASSGTAASDSVKPAGFGDRVNIVSNSTAVPPANTNRFGFNAGEITSSWTNSTDIRIRVCHPACWDSLIPVASIDTVNNIVTMNSHTLSDIMPVGAAWRRENVYEDLAAGGQTGQMYLNRSTGVLTYVPRPGESPANSMVIAPVLNELIRISNGQSAGGTTGSLVGRITFGSGLVFSHTNSPTLASGFIGAFTNRFTDPLGAITVIGGTGVTLNGVTMTHIGEAAVIFGPGSMSNSAINSTFSDIGASPIIGGQEQRMDNARYPDGAGDGKGGNAGINGPSTPEWAIGNSTVSNNLITDFGHLISNSAGIAFGRNQFGNTFTHNEISIGPLCGIHLGYNPGGFSDTYLRTWWPEAGGSMVSYNYIHDMGFSGAAFGNDMGAIYSPGPQLGTIFQYNKIENIYGSLFPTYYGGALNSHGGDIYGIYNDDYSNGVTIQYNLVSMAQNSFQQLKGKNQVVYNNIFYSDFSGYSFGVGPGFTFVAYFSEDTTTLFATITKNIYVVKNTTGNSIDGVGGMSAIQVTADDNLFYEIGGTLTTFSPDFTLASWQAGGRDVHSLFNVDPLFTNPSGGDFSLQAGSPAPALGFVPFDLSTAGLA